MKPAHLFPLAVFTAVSTFAMAQAPAPATPAPVVAAPAPLPAATKSGCDKPEAYPGNAASDNAKRTWQKALDAYGACTRKFSEEQRIIADTAVRSGNDAVAEYNAVVQSAREEIAKPKS